MDDPPEKVITVSELSVAVKNFVDKFDKKIRVIGEISNCTQKERATYFTLKDKDGVIDGILWGSYNTGQKIQNGLKVIVTGDIVVYRSTIQIKAFDIEKIGTGDLEKKYQILKNNFESRGYFDQKLKKKFPSKIRRIGIATSTTGAALQDILHVFKRENFYGQVYVKDCRVQGESCPQSVCESLKTLDVLNLDIIILARGGGSYEDLFGFSDENIVECIFECRTFVVSAIGHETDNMLSDFVADFRAPTPSIAAETICRNQKNELKYILDGNYIHRFQSLVLNHLKHVERNIPKIESPIDNLIKMNDLDNKFVMAKRMITGILSRKINYYDSMLNKLSSCDRESVLSQGYCMLLNSDGEIVKTSDQLKKTLGKMILLFADGSVKVEVNVI